MYDYTINLLEDARTRWEHVIAEEALVACDVIQGALRDIPYWGQAMADVFFEKIYRWSGGPFSEEIRCWADALGLSRGLCHALQCTYELSHLATAFGAPEGRAIGFGCTAGIVAVPGVGPVHLRTLDWDLPELRGATRVFKFTQGPRYFYSVGVPGFIGVLSGMVPGGYSVTINYASPEKRPTTQLSVSALVRLVLENCDTYDEAVYALERTLLSTSAFFTVCGVAAGEGCVIERTSDTYSRRDLQSVLVKTNHFEVQSCAETDEEFIGYSKHRARVFADRLARSRSLAGAVRALGHPDVDNELTQQKMVLIPAYGELHLL